MQGMAETRTLLMRKWVPVRQNAALYWCIFNNCPKLELACLARHFYRAFAIMERVQFMSSLGQSSAGPNPQGYSRRITFFDMRRDSFEWKQYQRIG